MPLIGSRFRAIILLCCGISLLPISSLAAEVRDVRKLILHAANTPNAREYPEFGLRDVKALTALLHDTNLEVQVVAASELGLIGDSTAVDSLCSLLQNGAPEARVAALGALSMIRDPRAIQFVAKASVPDNDMVGGVRESLAAMATPEAVEPLAELLNDSDPKLRLSSVEALGKVYDPRVVSLLTGALKDSDEAVRYSAAVALGIMGQPSAIAPLSAVINGGRGDHALALTALSRISNQEAVEVLAAATTGPDGPGAINALGASHHPYAVTCLLNALHDDRLAAMKPAIMLALQNTHSPKALGPLVDDFRTSASDDAAYALVGVGEAAIEPLIKLMTDHKADVRANAAMALGEIADKRACSVLVKALKDNNADVRTQAATALGLIADDRAVSALSAVLTDNSVCVRVATAEALGRIASPKAVPALIGALRFHDDNTFGSVTGALGEIGDRRALPPLLSLLSKPSLRTDACRAICDIGGKPAIPFLLTALVSRDNDVQRYAVQRLGKLRVVSAVPNLIAVLKDDDENVRSAAVRSLGDIRDKRATEPLINVLAHDGDFFVRECAAEALADIAPGEAVAPLLEAMDRENVILHDIGNALSSIRDPRVDDYCASALDNNNWVLVAACHRNYIARGLVESLPMLVQALWRRGDPEMAKDFVASGNLQLIETAKAWRWSIDSRNGIEYESTSLPGKSTKELDKPIAPPGPKWAAWTH